MEDRMRISLEAPFIALSRPSLKGQTYLKKLFLFRISVVLQTFFSRL